MKDFQDIIIENLFYNDEYVRRVLPFIKAEYFSSDGYKKIFENINTYVSKYNVPPTTDEIAVELFNDKTVNENTSTVINKILEKVKEDREPQNLDWLIDQSEKFCQERAITNAIMISLDLHENKKTPGMIPDILREALAVTFSTSIGHDYFGDYEHRYEYYTKQEYKIPIRLDYLKKITKGGFSRKTLAIILGGVHAGKTAHMCSLASDALLDNQNVLFISAEMAAEEISCRIDANLLDIALDDVKTMDKESFAKGINAVRKKTTGRLIVKEYPTATAHVGHFRSLLNELALKQNFVPDIIFIDYLNICASQRLSMGANVNSYTYMKVISEELRGLAVEKDVAIVTATQLTRSGFNSTDPNMEDIAESFGVAATADMIYSIVAPEDLIQKQQVLFKQLKNRYSDKNTLPKFFVGFDRPKMRFFDIENATEGLVADISSAPMPGKFDRGQKDNKFDGFKF